MEHATLDERRDGGGPRILLWPSTYTCLNMGDVAMLQAATSRLRQMWPLAHIMIPTENPRALLDYCGPVRPVTYRDWFADHYLLGRVHRLVPAAVSKALVRLKIRVGWQAPRLEQAAIRLKTWLRSAARVEFEEFTRASEEADVVVVGGAGGVSDTFPRFSIEVLRALEAAIRSGRPTAMFSHGFGPLSNRELVARARAVLPSVSLIALREGHSGPRLLESLGVDMSRVITTGDDAIELAYGARASGLGDGIGVNLRVGGAAQTDVSLADRVRPILLEFARMQGAPLVRLPIARQNGLDSEGIARLLGGHEDHGDFGASLDTPARVIARASQCRIVLTGAYHAGVFALAQGIPAVCLAQSAYFKSKFLGLRAQFGAGCEVLLVDSPDFAKRLAESIAATWKRADEMRPTLLEAARRQVELGRTAYARLREIVSPTRRRAIA